MIYQITHDMKRKLWCGPGAIALLTGLPTSTVYAHADAVAKRKVRSMYTGELIETMLRCGHRAHLVWQVLGNGRMTLRQWARTNGHLAAKQPVLIHVGNHYAIVVGRRYVDNQTGDPIHLSDSAYLRSYVKHAWTFERVGPAQAAPGKPAPKPRAPGSKDMARARRLASKHGITLERDPHGYWVSCAAFGDDDPHEGNNFAIGPWEVLSAVEDYVKRLATAPAIKPPEPAPEIPNTAAAATLFAIQRLGPGTAMDIACLLSIYYEKDITVKQVRGAALALINQGAARWTRGKLAPVATN